MGNRNIRFLLKVGLALCIGMFLWISSRAQGQGDLSSHTYDTVLSSNGYGRYSVAFPQWSPDSGTLKAVKVSASVSSQYGFTLSNASPRAASYALTLGHQDEITGSGISTPISNN